MARDVKTLKTAIEKQLTQQLEQISVVNLVDLFVEYAFASRASDVHIHPELEGVRVRFRVDGVLRDIFDKVKISQELHQEVISRIKVISGLRTDEHLAPQDGRCKVRLEGFGDVDVRVSIMPTYHGENAVLRILAETQSFTLKDLGYSPDDLKRIQKAMRRSYGMILANGPTGSGKSTTLYTMLKELNNPNASIISIEDPIEYSLAGTTQIQVNNQAGLTFANGLRSVLRQDPNIIMVGEIRDSETASIAVNAATTFPRLIDMGVPPFLVASTVNVAMGQRLVRQLCQSCKTERVLTEQELKSLSEIVPKEALAGRKFYVGKGCDTCNGTGYAGRVGVREVLEVNNEIRQLIMARVGGHEIKEAAIKAGMTTMLLDGLEKASRGLTSIEEMLRIIQE